MLLATTQQFRDAVRKSAKKLGINLGNSWTNKSTIRGRRTVGFRISYTVPGKALLKKVEKRLGKKGLTADTRITYSDSWGSRYIRGTCVIY